MWLVGCSHSDQLPQQGEFGQVLHQQARLATEDIEQLVAKSQSKQGSNDFAEYTIHYTAHSGQNPYRTVLVVQGAALVTGDVNLKFRVDNYNSNVNSSSSNLLSMDAGVDYLERRQKLNAGEAFTFVLDGAPFSVNAANDPNEMSTQLSLVESSNVQFQGIELQIWQGKGSKYGVMRYLWFIGLVLLTLWVYRVIVEKKADQVEDFLNSRKWKK
ncbi:hypothetical protein B9T33_04070 [Acinetobacter sp. ANC 5054]|uniref:hypothetical protein n=1 Tax=Acinetobacter sp. ANC 5054 TaxID=1977877 RepID=UPI000A34BB7C|nr:hypothetical protein [Acinetobacter sp. ANC 5054]OTG82633.1 hypothetical protein B9T33_04070 [Acinetobacter sp. ANC 5054]